MNFQLVIVNDNNTFFSGVKSNTPKIFNALKLVCEELKQRFASEFKVKRVIPTKKGYKFI